MKRTVIILLCFLLCLSLVACGTDQTSGNDQKADFEEGPDFIALISYAETALENITGSNVSVSTRKDDWNITKTNLRYVLSSQNVKIDGNTRDVIIKIEFEDDSYSHYKVFQLKIDGKDIDL